MTRPAGSTQPVRNSVLDSIDKMTSDGYLRYGDDGLPTDCQSLEEGPGGDEGSLHLDGELLWYVSERLQLVHVLGDALEVAIVERVLGVEKDEHPLEERREEPVEHVEQVEVAAAVVRPKVAEELREDLRVLLVDDAVRLNEHLVKVARRFLDQVQAERCQVQTQRPAVIT